jgi:hypothetical protein
MCEVLQAFVSNLMILPNCVSVSVFQVRPCNMYKEEYSDCTSIKARFHQYFIFGKTVDCSQWKRDFDNCVRWKDKKNSSALVKIKFVFFLMNTQ